MICNDILMDIFPHFDRPQLGLKLALLSPRFDALVDKYFDGKPELTIWRPISVHMDTKAGKAQIYANDSVPFPLPDRPLPSKLRFSHLEFTYIDHSVIEFLRANKQIFDNKGTNLIFKLASYLSGKENGATIWGVLAREIWPIFASNIHQLGFYNGDHLINLRRLISPTLLTDLNKLNPLDSGELFPAGTADDGPNATPGQALTKWLHTPTVDGQPKELFCSDHILAFKFDWIKTFKEEFLRSTTPTSYYILLHLCSMPEKPFELVNEGTKEKLSLARIEGNVLISYWLLKRGPIAGGETAQREDQNYLNKLNSVRFLIRGINCIGPLAPPTAADQSNENAVPSGAGPSK